MINSGRPIREYDKLASKYEKDKEYHLDMIVYRQADEIAGKVGNDSRLVEQ